MTPVHEPPSLWVTRFAPHIPANGRVLDLACGRGRNSRWLARQGFKVLAVDRNEEALSGLDGEDNIEIIHMDIEESPWPFADAVFDAIVVCRYLHRPLFPHLIASLASHGILIYETFMVGQETLGRPTNPAYLLQQDELLKAFSHDLRTIAFEQGCFHTPDPVYLQRICAMR